VKQLQPYGLDDAQKAESLLRSIMKDGDLRIKNSRIWYGIIKVDGLYN
jgi:hypothetical protein